MLTHTLTEKRENSKKELSESKNFCVYGAFAAVTGEEDLITASPKIRSGISFAGRPMPNYGHSAHASLPKKPEKSSK